MTRNWITAAALVALMASPALADQQRDRRRGRDNGQQQSGQQTERAQPRQEQQRSHEQRTQQEQRTQEQRAQEQRAQDQRNREQQARDRERATPRTDVRQDQGRRIEEQRRIEDQRRVEAQRRVEESRRYDNRRYNGGRYDSRDGYRGNYAVRRFTPRVIHPSIVTVVPYRPYVYRPSFGLGVYYGSDGYYPYGYTPRGYYDPLPGHYYGGLRITGAPRYARVFADGYFVGLVNDFDGIFQHLNLEAGPHHIEIEDDGYGYALAFDVYVRPGETITYRAGY